MTLDEMASKVSYVKLAILSATARRNADGKNRFPQVDQNGQYDFVTVEEELEKMLRKELGR